MIEHLSTISETIENLQKVENMYSLLIKAMLTTVKAVKTATSISKLLFVLRTTKIGQSVRKSCQNTSGGWETICVDLNLIFFLVCKCLHHLL